MIHVIALTRMPVPSRKPFSTNGDLVGTVVAFDGDTFIIDFYSI